MNKTSSAVLLREPKQRRSRELVERICDATLALSKDTGLRDLTTNNIAKAAGINVSSLYRFFPNKIAILYYIYQGWLGEIRETWDRYETEEDLLQLDYKDYFSSISKDWQVNGTDDYYASLEGILQIYPELQELESEHLKYYTNFFIR